LVSRKQIAERVGGRKRTASPACRPSARTLSFSSSHPNDDGVERGAEYTGGGSGDDDGDDGDGAVFSADAAPD